MGQENDAIQPDAEFQSDTGRLSAMEVIAARVHAATEDEISRSTPLINEMDNPPEPTDPPANITQNEPAEMAGFILPDVLDLSQFGDVKVPFKVNGVATQVPLSQVVRSAQINEAVDQRMQAVALKERELQERENEIAAKAAAAQENVVTGHSQDGLTLKPSDLIYEGNGDGFDNAIDQLVEQKILARLGTLPAAAAIPNAAELANEVKRSMAWDEALTVVGSQHGYLNDPICSDKFNRELQILSDLNPDASPLALAQATAKNVGDWLQNLTGVAPATATPTVPTTPAQPQTRADRAKAALGKTAVSSSSAALPTEPAAESASEIINGMRKQRGKE